jgi:hypothetical protein
MESLIPFTTSGALVDCVDSEFDLYLLGLVLIYIFVSCIRQKKRFL